MVAVVLVQAFVSLGWLFFVGGDASVVAGEQSGGGPAVPLVGSVSIRPLQGWEQGELPTGSEGARFTNGTGFLDAFAFSGAGTLEELLNHYIDIKLTPGASSLQTSPVADPLVVGPGINAVRASYIGVFNGVQAPIEGELTAVITPDGSGLVFDGWAQEGSLGFVLEDIRAMIQRLEVS